MSTTVDSTRVSIGVTGVTLDATGARAPLPGWPCALLGKSPPSVFDKQSNPSADDYLPAVLALTPRGAAWGTDEVGDGAGASPVMRGFWRAIAGFAADVSRRDFAVVTQCFPSAVTTALPDWEVELGLPDPCTPGRDAAGRLAAVRARFGAIGGASPGYMVCLAAALGYDITIEEPTQFFIDDSTCVDGVLGEGWFRVDDNQVDDALETFALTAPAYAPGDEVAGGIFEDGFVCDDGMLDDTPVESFAADPNGMVWKFWVAHVARHGDTWFEAADGAPIETYFRIDDGELGATPLETFALSGATAVSTAGAGELTVDPLEGFATADDLECVLRRACPPHTQIVFAYDRLAA